MTRKHIEKFSGDRGVTQWIFSIYKSEYCNEELDTLMYDWSFDEFLNLDNQIRMLLDLEKAANEDRKREEQIKAQHAEALRQSGY